MPRQVGLLRGINVGGHNKIGMAGLRGLLGELGFENVRTHLQSGNIVFTVDTSSEESARTIEAGIADRFASVVPVLVRTRDELARVIDENPLRDVATDPAKLLVMFLAGQPYRQQIAAVDTHSEVFALGRREIYLWCPDGVRATKLSQAFWEKQLGLTATGRNWNTVTKLLSLADS